MIRRYSRRNRVAGFQGNIAKVDFTDDIISILVSLAEQNPDIVSKLQEAMNYDRSGRMLVGIISQIISKELVNCPYGVKSIITEVIFKGNIDFKEVVNGVIFEINNVEPEEAEPTYYCEAFYKNDFTDLEDSIEVTEYSEAVEYAWHMVNRGSFVRITNRETGDIEEYTSIDDFEE